MSQPNLSQPNPESGGLPEVRVRRMMTVVEQLARRLAMRLPDHVPVDDLVAAGNQALVSALERFNALGSEGFQAYAESRIRGAMLDELRARDPLSRDDRAHAKRIAAARRTLLARLCRAPAADEVAAALGVSLETYWKWLSSAATHVTVPLDDSAGDGPAPVCESTDVAADEELCRNEMRSSIDRAVAALQPRAQRVVHLHYTEGLTLRQIGDQLGLSESRVCQIHAEAVRRIRELCRDPGAPWD